MTLFYDTETTGLPRKEEPGSDQHPCITQLACLLVDDSKKEVAKFVSYVYPEGWTHIDPIAEQKTGISVAMCLGYGLPLKVCLGVFNGMAKKATRVVGHNVQFDRRMVDHEFRRIGRQTPYEVLEMSFCTMQATTPLCRIPAKFGSGYKWPRLEEALRILMGRELIDAHDALADVSATRDLYFWLVENGHAS